MGDLGCTYIDENRTMDHVYNCWIKKKSCQKQESHIYPDQSDTIIEKVYIYMDQNGTKTGTGSANIHS